MGKKLTFEYDKPSDSLYIYSVPAMHRHESTEISDNVAVRRGGTVLGTASYAV